MGTRCLTYVYDEGKSDKPFVCMYRQYDGYPSGHGKELAEFLTSGEVVNGIPLGSKQKMFNGMSCLAAQMVSNFKTDVGNIYLYAPEVGQDCMQDFEYHIFSEKIKVTNYDKNVLFEGCWHEFADYCSEEESA